MAIDNSIFEELNKVLSSVNLETVSADGAGFTDVPEGYYLCEVLSAELKATKTTGAPMASFCFGVMEDGHKASVDARGNESFVTITGTKGRRIYVNWVLSDAKQATRYISDMLKFTDETGEAYLPKESFTDADVMAEAIQALIGTTIYISAQESTKKDGTSVMNKYLIKWKVAEELGLPVN